MSGPITDYKKERARLDAAWEAECQRNGWPGGYDTAIFKAYWAAYIEHERLTKELERRHYKMPFKASDANSRLELWAHITKVTLVVLWTFRNNRSHDENTRTVDPAFKEVMRALHQLKVPWAYDPPYPELTRHETEDLLLSIANRLEREDLEAESEAENGEKTVEKIKDSKLRSFVCELQDLVKQHGYVPRGKKREIARRLCRNNLEKAMALERNARNWKHLYEQKPQR